MVHPDVNKAKTNALVALHAVYSSYGDECLSTMVVARRWDIDRKEYQDFFPPSTSLTSHVRTCARDQAVWIFQSWLESIYGVQLRDYIVEHRDEFTDDERVQLFTIGLHKVTEACAWGKYTIEQRMVDKYWSWVWDEEITGKRPHFGSNGMLLTENCLILDVAEEAKGLGSHWIAVSCGILTDDTPRDVNGRALTKRTVFPLADHPCLRDGTKLAKAVLVQQRPSDGRWTMRFTEYVPHVADLPPDAPKIAVDVGKTVSAATSDGRLWGEQFVHEFDELHGNIKSIRANRQRQKIKKDSERLHALERKLTAMMKTAMGTVANQLIKAYPGYRFVLEDLCLTGTRGQKRFAYKLLQRLLDQKVCTEKQNPAYTSQECPSCGHVCRGNRHGINFKCLCCGRVSHADYVGAHNLLGRSEDKEIELETEVATVRAVLRERYHRRRGSSSGGRVTRRRTTGRPDAQGLARAKAPRGEASNSSTEQSVGAKTDQKLVRRRKYGATIKLLTSD